MENEDLGFRKCYGGGRARLVVEKAHLPEEFVLREHGQDDLPAVVREDRDFDAAREDHVERVAEIVLEKHHRIFRIFPA